MEWQVNDNLKAWSYGHKKEADSITNQDKISEYE